MAGENVAPSGPATSNTPVTARWPALALIGTYPPPYGGVSVHLQRLVERLEEAGADFVLYNTVASGAEKSPHVRRLPRRLAVWYLAFLLRHRHRVVHLLSSGLAPRVAFGCVAACRRGKYVLSLHNQSLIDALRRGKTWRTRLLLWALRRMDVVVASNSRLARACVEEVGLAPRKVRLIPAFIPPTPRNTPLPPAVQTFIRAHSPLLSAVAWYHTHPSANFSNHGAVYGIDLMLDMLDRLRADYPNLGLVLSLSGGTPAALEQTVAICRQRAGDRMLVLPEPLEDLSDIFRASTLFLRPTSTDGDAVSIREALHCGTPVVTSDAAPRPEPCVLFRARDLDDFEQRVRGALREQAALRARVAAFKMPDNAAAIIALYEALISGSS